MFFETLREIYYSIKQNRVRTILSGFGVSWGILILVVLFGTGKGFQDAVMGLFSVFAQKSLYVYGGVTSQKYKNTKEGVGISFSENYISTIKNQFGEISHISPEATNSVLISNGEKSSTFKCVGVNEEYMKIKILKIKDEGRHFNMYDVLRRRNVVIVGENVANYFFGNKKAIDKQIDINGVLYKIVGVLKNDDIFSASEINTVYLPFSSYIRNVAENETFKSFAVLLKNNVNSIEFERNLKNYIANKFAFSSDDRQAVYIVNFETQTSSFESLFKGLKLFIWLIGICFLISGVVGICNIMLVVVRERTSEIGIRMAVGALPKSIINLILIESMVITVVSGIIGMGLGKICLLLINWLLSFSVKSGLLLEEATFDFQFAALALLVLVVAGIIAGAFPAIKASQIEPVNAIRYENRE